MGRHSTGDDVIADWRSDRVGSARRGENPMVLAKMRTGYAVLGDTQHLPGYCVLLYDDGRPLDRDPQSLDAAPPDHLTDLTRADRAEFLFDMSLLGEAVFEVCNGFDPSFRRINYEILGNSLPHLHAHVHPRYAWEDAEYRRGPVWRYPDEVRNAAEHAPDERHEALREAIVGSLRRAMSAAYGP